MKINDQGILAEVTAAFHRYETALVSNDVETLDALFWHNEHVIRYGVGENLYGHNEILVFRSSRSSKGLARDLRRTVITTFGADYATANTEFTRDGSEHIGRQSHAWARLPEGWRIVAAHVSLLNP